MWRELPAETREWSEEDWETFFKEQDERHYAQMTAQPWDESFEFEEGPSSVGGDGFSLDADEDELLDDIGAYEREFDDALDHIPAWRAAVEFCDRTIEYISPLCERGCSGPMEFVARTLITECYLVPDYLLAGHELGYDEDTLLGNIALCLRSRRSLDRCIRCLERLGGAREEGCRKLIIRGTVARIFVERRIAELRALVWWR